MVLSISLLNSFLVLFKPAVLTIHPIVDGIFISLRIFLIFFLSSELTIFLDIPPPFAVFGINTLYLPANEIKVVNNELFYFIKNKATIKLSIDNIENNTIKLIEFDKQLNSEHDIRSYENIDLTIPNQIIVKEKTI